MESSSVSLNSLPVIPPISSGDNGFLNCLNDWMAEEMLKVDPADPEQCYHVHKEAFNRVSQCLWLCRCFYSAVILVRIILVHEC